MKHKEFHQLLEKAIDIRCDIEELKEDLNSFWIDEPDEGLSQTLYYLIDRLDDLDSLASDIESDFDEANETEPFED